MKIELVPVEFKYPLEGVGVCSRAQCFASIFEPEVQNSDPLREYETSK